GDASDLQFEASVALGEKLPEVISHGGDRRSRLPDGNLDRLSLRDLGITKRFSSYCQRLARLPPEARARMKKDFRDKATRRFSTREPGRALTVPTINVNQFANMVMTALEEKVSKAIASRKVENLVGMRDVEKLRFLKRRFAQGDTDVI